jgi:hypothetical protein
LYIAADGDRKNSWWVCIRYRDENQQHVRPLGLAPNWMTDVDYDGIDWGDSPEPFRWGRKYDDLASFAEGVGIERHAIRVNKREIFENDDLPGQPARITPPLLTLRPGCNAVDAGAALPNIHDEFVGRAPDLGAHEFGRPTVVYGPRPQE